MSAAYRPYRYPTDTSEEERGFVMPYLILLPEDAGQHRHTLRPPQEHTLCSLSNLIR
jgi:hypothetical protein